MFIQITKDKIIRKKDIIGIFDLDTSTVSAMTKGFLTKAEKNSKTVGIHTLPKSFVLSGDKQDCKIYFSPNMTRHIANN